MASAPQPALLWSFENSLREIITGALPNSTIGTSISYSNGKYGQGFSMIPTTSNGFIYYTSDNIPWIPLFPYAQGLTTSVWINYTVPGTAGWIMDLSTYNGGAVFRDRIRLTISSTPAINLNIGATTGGFSYNVPGSGQTGTWYHYAFVINISSGLIISYLNGVQTNSNPVPSSWSSDIQYYGGNIGIGCRVSGSDPATTATIDDLRIYSTALSAAQIYGIYQSRGIPPRLTMVPSTGGLPSPTYAWPFQNSVIDAVQGVYPASANVGGVNWNTWLSGNTWPYYDSTAPVYGSNSIILNSINSAYSNGISYTINSPFGGYNSFAITFWLKPIQPITSSFGYYLTLSGVGGTINFWINSSYGMSWSAASSLAFITNGFPNISAVVNKWMHIGFCITNTGSSITSQFFTNGTGGLVSSSSSILDSNVFNSLSLGRFQGGAGESEAGVEFGDLRIFNTALTPTQIQTIYQNGGNLYGGSTVQPALFWSFNGTLKESVTGYLPVGTTGATNPTGASLAFTSGKYGQGLQFIPYLSNGFALWNTTTYSIPLARTYFPYAGGMSVCFWYMPTSLATGGLLFSTSAFTSLTVYGQLDLIYINLDTSGSIGLNTQATSGGTVPAFGVEMGKVAVNNWVHVAFGVDTQNIYMYINGVLTGTRAQPSNWATTDITSSGYWMGGMSVGTQHFAAANGALTGIMNDLRVYSSLLSASQIQAIYQSGGIPPTLTLTPSTPSLPSPQYAFPFNGSNVDSITGLTPAVQYPITGNSALQGGAVYVKTAPTSTTAVSFDGTTGYMNLGTASPTNFDHSTSNLFFEAWVYRPTGSVGGPIYRRWAPLSNGTDDLTFAFASSLSAYFRFSTTSIYTTTANSVPLNTWTHLAVSFVPTTLTAYLFYNGVMDGSAVGVGTISYNSANPTVIGNSYLTFLNGYIQDMRIVQGGIVPVTNFTPASPSFQYVLPSYVTGTGGTVFTLQSQFVNYTNGLLSGQAINFLSNASVSPATSNVTYNISLIPITSFTVTAWINPTIIGKNQNIFIASYGQNGDGDLRMRVDYQSATPSSYKIWLGYPFVSGTWTSVNPATLYSVGQWAHVAFTVSGGDMVSNVVTGYYNGSFIGTATSATRTNTNNLTKLTIGSFCSGAFNSQFNGLVQDVRMYSQVLNAAQIQTIYQSGGNLYGGNLVQPNYLWPFNGSTIDIIRGLDTAKSNIAGAYTAGNPNQKPWPYYDKTGQKAGASSIVLNNFGTISSNAIEYSLTNGLSIDQSNAVSYSFWLKFLSSQNNYSPIRFFSSMGQTMGAIQQYNNLLQLIFSGAAIPGTTISQINTNFNISATGIWYHIAVVVTSSGMQLYGNGTLLGTNTYSPPLSIQSTSNTIASFNLSCNGIINPTYATSSNELADLRIYNTALSTSQIQTIYQSGGVSPSALLTSG